LGITNDEPKVFKIKIIPIIEVFVYDEAVTLHPSKKKLCSRILHIIIAHNIFLKKGHYDSHIYGYVPIDGMIKGCQLNLPFIIMKNMIMTHD
jgi:hypothetical protein